MGLGADRLRAILYLTFPQIRTSVLAGAFFSFMASFDDLVISLYLSGASMTLPRKTFDNILFAVDPTIAAISVLQIMFIVVLGSGWFLFSRDMRPAPLLP
jgi:putative spermidine/putrescine transport system permease protein